MEPTSGQTLPEDPSGAGLTDRLRLIYRTLGGQERVAECVGVAKGTPGRWARGESRISLEDAAALCAAADVSLEWLAHGGTLRSGDREWVEAGAVHDAAELVLELTKEMEQPVEPVRLARIIMERARTLTQGRNPQAEPASLTRTTDR